MMKQYWLKEDKLPSKLFVGFSSKITKNINTIAAYNRDNIEAIYQWRDYLNGIRSYISNPVIAWDYTNRYPRFPNGAKVIRDFDYNVAYTIKTNNTTNQPYVYVFMVNLKTDEFGLKVPPMIEEKEQYNSSINRIIRETINSYLKNNLLLAS